MMRGMTIYGTDPGNRYWLNTYYKTLMIGNQSTALLCGSRLAATKMPRFTRSLCCLLVASLSALAGAQDSTFNNPILPGFHPDPSCIFVPEWDDTFFCASSSFNAFPGIPIHASKDLQNWKLIGTVSILTGPIGRLRGTQLTVVAHVLNREEQLPELAYTNRSTAYVLERFAMSLLQQC